MGIIIIYLKKIQKFENDIKSLQQVIIFKNSVKVSVSLAGENMPPIVLRK